MKHITGDIKFFEANITHKRSGNKNHFFKNKTNAVLIDLKNKTQQNIPTYPSLFSLKKFNLDELPNISIFSISTSILFLNCSLKF